MICFIILCTLIVMVFMFLVLNNGFCFHKFITGRFAMGDGWGCEKCNLEFYPETFWLKWLYKLLGRTRPLSGN